MAEMKTACLVKSLAGHDKKEFYIIIRVQGEYAYLSDGRKHPPDLPKRKNIKHLQPLKEYDKGLREKLIMGSRVEDEEIARWIRSRISSRRERKCQKQT